MVLHLTRCSVSAHHGTVTAPLEQVVITCLRCCIVEIYFLWFDYYAYFQFFFYVLIGRVCAQPGMVYLHCIGT